MPSKLLHAFSTRPAAPLAGLLLLALLAGVRPACGQSFGLRVAGTSSSFQGTADALETSSERYDASVTRREAFEAGIHLGVGVSDWLTLRPELRYARRGMVLQETYRQQYFGDENRAILREVSTVDETVKLAYLEAPLLARIDVRPSAGSFAPSLLLGPALGVRVRGEADSEVTSQIPEFEGGTYTDDVDAPRFDVGLVAGVELAYETDGGARYFLDLRYQAGASDVSWSNDAGVTPLNVAAPSVELRNQVVSIGIGLTAR